jgi:lipid-A-disaccharide synthase
MSEVSRLGPVFAKTAEMLLKQRPELRFVTPVATPALRPVIESQLEAAGVAANFRLIDGDSIEAMAAADVVLLASGTAALESALLGKPTVAGYAISRLGAAIVRMIGGIKTPHVTIPNLLTDEPLIPEFIQNEMQPAALAQAVWELLEDPERRAEIGRRFATLREDLALGADDRAAEAIIDLAS